MISHSLKLPEDKTKWTLIFANVTEKDIRKSSRSVSSRSSALLKCKLLVHLQFCETSGTSSPSSTLIGSRLFTLWTTLLSCSGRVSLGPVVHKSQCSTLMHPLI